jgi:hypothetical protein
MRSTCGRVIVPVALLSASLMVFAPTVRSHLTTAAASSLKTQRRITVTTASDAANGDTSGFRRLISNPGADGISLREAILVTNNDPGRYAIRFARSLDGAVIRVGSATGLDLPALLGGRVSINGDVDDDDRPDVTIRGGFQRPYPSYCLQAEFLCPAFRISSSGNELLTLDLRVFATGVLFTPASDALRGSPIEKHQTYANNNVRGLVMRDIVWAGIDLNWHRCVLPCKSQNRWVDTTFVDNTINAGAYGISFKLSGSIGDRLERFTIADNTIQIARSSLGERIGIVFEAGRGIRNHISDVTIDGNTVRGDLTVGIRLGSGVLGGDSNTIQRVRITNNLVSRSPRVQVADRDPEGPWCGRCFGVDIFIAEGSGLFDRDLRPIQYADRNHIRDVEIGGNTVSGPWRRGVTIQPACCGSSHNRAEGIRIRGNTIRLEGLVEGVHIDGGDCYVPVCPSWKTKPTRSNQVSDVSIHANEISIEGDGSSPDHDFMKGGIILVGGIYEARNGKIEGVSITNNRIATEMVSIGLLGGGGGKSNVIFDVRIEGNRILREPLPIRYVLSDVKGITVTGGFARARGNQVSCVAVEGNLVAGVRDDVSVIANGESEGDDQSSSENTASVVFLTLEDAIAHAPDVFIGTVTSRANSGPGTTVAVEETWRSEYLTRPAGFGLPETVEVRVAPRGSPCSFMQTASGDRLLTVGERYLFVPYERSDSVFWDDGWTWTTKFESSLERFRPPRVADRVDATPKAADETSEAADDRGLGVVWLVGPALVVALALAVVFRRRQRR